MPWSTREYYKFACPEGHTHFSQQQASNCRHCKAIGVPKAKRNAPGIGYVYRNVLDLFKEELSPAQTTIRGSLDEQTKLFDDGAHISNAHIKMGLFYEMMTAVLFGGKVIEKVQEINMKLNGGKYDIVPDVISNRRKHAFESKACQQGSKLNLMDFQINRYDQLCLLYKFIVYYAVWRHDFKGIHQYKGKIIDLYRDLSEATQAGVVLPLSIILHIWEKAWRENLNVKGVSRYVGDKWHHCTSMASNLINRFVIEPEEVISDLDLSSDNYNIVRKLTPKNLMVQNQKIAQFPLMIIKDVNPKGWVKEYSEKAPF